MHWCIDNHIQVQTEKGPKHKDIVKWMTEAWGNISEDSVRNFF
jgi:hypothetical protein